MGPEKTVLYVDEAGRVTFTWLSSEMLPMARALSGTRLFPSRRQHRRTRKSLSQAAVARKAGEAAGEEGNVDG
jgi:hypothetical protein